MRATADIRLRIWAAPLVALCCVASGCAHQTKLREKELAELAAWFPGWYDNREQTQSERAAGRTIHESVTLSVVPIYAPLLSDTAFYLQENARGDLRRVLSQRIAAFSVTRDGRIIERLYALSDAPRWRDAARNPDLFKSLVGDDVQEVSGCELTWAREAEHFRGSNDPATCRTPAPEGGGAPLQMRSTMVLTSSTLDIDQQVLAANGQEARGVPADYHFRRLSEAPVY